VLSSLLERQTRWPRVVVLLLGLALVAVVGWLDYVSAPTLLLNFFYLLPVMLIAWATASTAYGLIAAFATFLVGPLEEYLTGFRHTSLLVAVWNAGLHLAIFCVVLVLLGKVRQLVNRLREQAANDELTGLANLRTFRDVATREIERSRRYEHELSLAFLDIDDFKAVNDRLGHAAGDRVLVTFASIARAAARTVDTVARIGGDEFVILMPETGAAAALPLAERLRAACPLATGSGQASVTCSVGLATFECPPGDMDDLLKRGDTLMYEAKAAGGDCVRHAHIHGVALA
jgi:diguanylate cyclase (GGDEF)-like protein